MYVLPLKQYMYMYQASNIGITDWFKTFTIISGHIKQSRTDRVCKVRIISGQYGPLILTFGYTTSMIIQISSIMKVCLVLILREYIEQVQDQIRRHLCFKRPARWDTSHTSIRYYMYPPPKIQSQVEFLRFSDVCKIQIPLKHLPGGNIAD